MATDIEYIKLINKLIELTQDSKITWEKTEPSIEMNSSFSHVKVVYECNYKDNHFRLYEVNSKVFEEDVDSRFYWDKDVVLDIVDENNYVLHKIPNKIDKDDLLTAVKNQRDNIDEIITNILEE